MFLRNFRSSFRIALNLLANLKALKKYAKLFAAYAKQLKRIYSAVSRQNIRRIIACFFSTFAAPSASLLNLLANLKALKKYAKLFAAYAKQLKRIY